MSALYIHVPFCLSKCGYCAFYSRVPCKDDIALYLNQLRKEAKERILPGAKAYETIFIGGGNPSALGLAGIEQIIEIIDDVGCRKKMRQDSDKNQSERFGVMIGGKLEQFHCAFDEK